MASQFCLVSCAFNLLLGITSAGGFFQDANEFTGRHQIFGLTSYGSHHVDNDGRPNLMRAVFDNSYLDSLSLTDNEKRDIQAVRLRVSAFSNELQTSMTVIRDGIPYAMPTQITGEQIYSKIKDELALDFGLEFVERVSRCCYRQYLAERSLIEFVALPLVAEQIGVDKEKLSDIANSGKVKAIRLKNEKKTKAILIKAFRDIVSKLNPKNKRLILKRLNVEDGMTEIPEWILYVVLSDAKPQLKYLLTSRKLKFNQDVFDYSLLLENNRAFSYLELVEDQVSNFEQLVETWQKDSTVPAEKNEQLLDLLLPGQMELVEDFAWREVYFRGSVVDFFENSFIRKELGISDSDLTRLLAEIKRISLDATKAVAAAQLDYINMFGDLLNDGAKLGLQKMLRE